MLAAAVSGVSAVSASLLPMVRVPATKVATEVAVITTAAVVAVAMAVVVAVVAAAVVHPKVAGGYDGA